jgi:hypothetical protein
LSAALFSLFLEAAFAGPGTQSNTFEADKETIFGKSFVFASAKDKQDKLALKSLSYMLKSWSPAEMSLIEKLVARVNTQAPGLIDRAACDSKINFCRISNVEAKMPIAGVYSGTSISKPDVIVLSDAFFKANGDEAWQYHLIMHELVHQADAANRISYSKEWAKFAEHGVTTLKKKCLACPPEQRPALEALLRSSGICPSLYACEDLSEALAEYYVAYKTSSFDVGPEIRTLFASKLDTPDTEDCNFNRQYKLGQEYFASDQFDKAVNSLELAAKLVPDAPMPLLSLAMCYAQMENWKKSFEFASRSLKRFEELSISDSDPYKVYSIELGMFAFSKMNATSRIAVPVEPRHSLNRSRFSNTAQQKNRNSYRANALRQRKQ